MECGRDYQVASWKGWRGLTLCLTLGFLVLKGTGWSIFVGGGLWCVLGGMVVGFCGRYKVWAGVVFVVGF